MKVAYITSHFPCGPGERFFEAEVASLAALRQEITIVPTRPRRGVPVHAGVHLPVIRLQAFGAATMLLAAAQTCKRPRAVWRALREIVFRRYRLRTKMKNLALFPKALAVAYRLEREGIDHIHAQWLSTPSTIAYVASQLCGVPWSCTAHQFDIFEDNLIAEKANSARFIRAISGRNRDFIIERAGQASASRCLVVHLGVDVPARISPSQNGRIMRLLCPANLVQKKGHEYLLQALAQLRERGIPFECDFAGNGILREKIEARIADLGLRARITLRGVVSHDRLCAELQNGRYDAVVIASTEEGADFEGIPVALMEAMAAGVPCISTETGSIAELIQNGVNSRLVPQRDPAALAAAIAELARDPEFRKKLGQNAREQILKQFDTRKTTKELFELMSTR